MPLAAPVNENSVAQQPLTRARLQPADFGAAGEMIGRAVQNAGHDVTEFAHEQDKINEFYDTAAVKKADAAVQEELAPVRASVLSSVGTEAVGAKADALKQITDIRQRYASSMSNPRQQRMFNEAFDRLQASEHSTYDEHEAKQSRVAAIASAKSMFDANVDRAVSLRVNPGASKQALADAIAQIPAANPGAPKPVLDRLQAEAVSNYHVAIATAIRDTDGDVLEAKHYMDEHAKEVLPEDDAKFRHSIKQDVEDAATDAAYGQVLAEVHGGKSGPPTAEHAAGQDASAAATADPLRGRGSKPVKGGEFHASRDGGARLHDGIDIPAPIGTPVQPPAAGVVEKVWFDPKGGNSVLIRQADGRTTGYAHLRNVNVKEGDQVDTDSTIGAVGNTGSASHGSHLHYTVRNADGNRVDPTGQTWKTGDLPAYSADRVDKQAMYDAARRVATDQNLSVKQYDALLRRVDGDIARNDNIKQRAQEDAVDAVGTILDKLGDKFTSTTQIPANIRDALPPGKLDAYREKAKQNARGDDVLPGGQTYLDMLEMSGNAATQDQFSRADLSALSPTMSKAEYLSLRKAQIEIRNGGGKESQTAVDYSRIDAMVNRYAPQTTGLDFKSKMTDADKNAVRLRHAQVTEIVRKQVEEAQQKKGTKLTDDELGQIVRAQVAPIYATTTHKGWLWDSKVTTTVPRALAPAGAQRAVAIPNTDRQQIIDAYKRHHNGSLPSEAMIAQVYLDHGGGLK
jgi:murein DD-endopeptidase MepM/ murein hydrolase activator NlpD